MGRARIRELRQMMEISFDFHKVSIDELCKRFNTNFESGLTDTEAAKGLEQHGPNVLTPPSITWDWVNLCKCLFSDYYTKLLWFGAINCFVTYSVGIYDAHLYFGILLSALAILFSITSCYLDICNNYLTDIGFELFFMMQHVYGIVLCFLIYSVGNGNMYLAVLFFALAILKGFYSYSKDIKSAMDTKSAMEKLNNVAPQDVLCRRNGEKRHLMASELTLGDIVEMNQGDVIPADIRLLECIDFKVNNAFLTGDDEPQKRRPEFTSDNVLRAKNIAFYSSKIIVGRAVGMVVQIGNNTVIGGITQYGSLKYYLYDTDNSYQMYTIEPGQRFA